MRVFLCDRKIGGAAFIFWLDQIGDDRYIVAENDCGEKILFSKPDNFGFFGAYTLYGYLPPWVLRRVEKIFLRLMKENNIDPGFSRIICSDCNFRSINA